MHVHKYISPANTYAVALEWMDRIIPFPLYTSVCFKDIDDVTFNCKEEIRFQVNHEKIKTRFPNKRLGSLRFIDFLRQSVTIMGHTVPWKGNVQV